MAQPTAAQGKDLGGQEILLQVDINRQNLNETVACLQSADGELSVGGDDLTRWRLRLPAGQPLSVAGRDYYPLDTLPGARYQLDETNLRLTIELPPEAFEVRTVDQKPWQIRRIDKPSPGGFLNYDVFVSNASGITTNSELLETGFFNRYGVGTATMLSTDAADRRREIRLDTTWTADAPERLASLRLGDAISRSGSWGRAVRFGGIQYATNFATQPDLVTMPMRSVTGQAALPSTVDVYVNNMLASHKEIQPGPFSISNLPVITGSGDVRVVVKDILGREQIISQPFYASASLLAKGVDDFSYELGSLRRNYGLESNDYGRTMGALTHRRGLTDALTGEVHGEFQSDRRQTLGLGFAFLVDTIGSVDASAAVSHSGDGGGSLAAIGFSHLGRVVSASARTVLTSRNFTQIGLEADQRPPARLSYFNLGLNGGAIGSFGFSYIQQNNRDNDRVDIAAASYSLGLGSLGFLSAVFSKMLNGNHGTTVSINWTLPLGERTSASASTNKTQGKGESFAQVQQSLPAGSGFGYIVQAGDQGSWRAGLQGQGEVGTYGIDVVQSEGQRASTYLNASGGIALIGGSAHPSRKIADSFALVQVPGYSNVRVYADNQPVGVTNAKGEALLPRLRAYEKNPVSIEQLDLPDDATVGALSLEAVPYYRSGQILPFPVQRSYGALLRIELSDGQPMPAGAVAMLVGQEGSFTVGHGGQLYVTGLVENNRIRLSWGDQACTVEVPFSPPPRGGDPLPDLGVFVCQGVQP